MAVKVVEDKKPAAASLLPVTVAEKKKTPTFPPVLLVSLWAFLTAAIFLGCDAFDYVLHHYHIHIHPPSWFTNPKLTGAAAAEERAIRHGVVWSSAVALAAAVLVLLHPGLNRNRRRCRFTLAYIALAATAATHVMTARVVILLLTADPGDILFWILSAVDFSFLAAGDIICFMALLGRNVLPC